MKWWRCLMATVCLLAALALPVRAEKIEWADSFYDFTKARRVLVYDLTVDPKAELTDDLAQKVAQEEYLKTAARPKYELVRPQPGTTPAPGTPNPAADLCVTAEIMKWHDDSYIKDGYTSEETRTETRERKHPDGTKTKEEYTYTVPVYYPPQTIYTSTVRVRFVVYDGRTGKRVMEKDEQRERQNSRHGQQGIFGRISKAFFDDLGKKMKQEAEE